MKIRSVTVNTNIDDTNIGPVSSLLADARSEYPVEVQTSRVSVVPINGAFKDVGSALDSACKLEELAISSQIDYIGGFGLGAYPKIEELNFLKWLPKIFDRTDRIFSNCQLSWNKKINMLAIKSCSNLIKILSKIDDGFLNLRFAGLFNCPPNNPFFPTSYACGESPNFSISIEGADIATKAFKNVETLLEARNKFMMLMRDNYCVLLSKSLELEERYGISFYGVDFTLAPTPSMEGSIASALEELGIEPFGSAGTLFLSSFLSDCIKSLGGKIGFSGLMYPVMEDGIIAKRTSQGLISLDSLLSYSSVCGTGLDCVPLPGDVSEKTLNAILLDVSALSVRLEKPLTARLFPICGKRAGDTTEFDFPYFSNTRIMGIKEGKVKDWKDKEIKFNV